LVAEAPTVMQPEFRKKLVIVPPTTKPFAFTLLALPSAVGADQTRRGGNQHNGSTWTIAIRPGTK